MDFEYDPAIPVHEPGQLLYRTLSALKVLGASISFAKAKIGVTHAPITLAYGEDGAAQTLAQVSMSTLSLLNADPDTATIFQASHGAWTSVVAFGEFVFDATFLELFENKKQPTRTDQAGILRFLESAMLALDFPGQFIITWGSGFRLDIAEDGKAAAIGFTVHVPVDEQTWTHMRTTKQLEIKAALMAEATLTSKQLSSESNQHLH